VIAAIYARKSTEQFVADDQKSVTRQIAHARAFATGHGWLVDDAYVFVDDGISGAEFAARPGFVRLMAALKPRPAFQILIMTESARLGREAWETGYALKQLLVAGVRVFFSLERRECTFDHPLDKLQFSIVQAFDEMERARASQRSTEKAISQARAGHVTGGRVFGYDNVPVLDPSGVRSHVERRINEVEAAVVRRIFALAATGLGQAKIARQLNAEGAVSPRAQQQRLHAWAISSVHEVLFRPLYRGEARVESDTQAKCVGSKARQRSARSRMDPAACAGAAHRPRGPVAGSAHAYRRGAAVIP
jgi:site-specific DNA recombinase